MYQPKHLNEAQCLQSLLHAKSFCLANFVAFYLTSFVASFPFSYTFFPFILFNHESVTADVQTGSPVIRGKSTIRNIQWWGWGWGSPRGNTTQKEQDFKVPTVYTSVRYKNGIASVGLKHDVIRKEHCKKK